MSQRSKAYKKWQQMNSRCYDSYHAGFKNYGGRGIAVCRRWRNSFDDYYADVGNPPFIGASIDRVDNDWHYEQGNIRWATRAEQNNNRRYVHVITNKGRSATLSEWAADLGIPYRTLKTRFDNGWSDEDIIGRPVRPVSVLKVSGVSWSKLHSKWVAYMYKTRKKRISLGYHSDWFDAVCTRKSAEVAHGF